MIDFGKTDEIKISGIVTKSDADNGINNAISSLFEKGFYRIAFFKLRRNILAKSVVSV